MPRRRRTSFVPTEDQVQTAEAIRHRLAENGYRIELLRGYGDTPYDFLAVYNYLIFRATAVMLLPNGTVSIRPYTAWLQHRDPTRAQISAIQPLCSVRIWTARLLPKSPIRANTSSLSHLTGSTSE